nr:DUF2779 domain-containing protein [Lachnospiraceae bacterium]
GNRVGDLARGYFGDYDLVEFDYDKNKMAHKTNELLQKGSANIAEAAFYVDNLYCAVDILHKVGDTYEIIEVKSSTEVKDIYVDDMAFQYYVLNKYGMNVSDVYIMYLNNTYVHQGELDLKQLFVKECYTDEIKVKQEEVEDNIKSIRAYLNNRTEPECDIDMYCRKPYKCAYYKYCSRHIPERSIFDVYKMDWKKRYKYYHEGIITYEDIIENKIKLNANQQKQVESALYNKPDEIDKDGIREFLNTLSYPIYHFDFETFQQAVPEYDGIHPYMKIPFQYSLHIEQQDGTLEHKEFLAKEGTDPRRAIAESICENIPENVCVLAYNMSFEKSVLTQLAKEFPDLSQHLNAIADNLHDLAVPFENKYYYSKDMQGLYTIKKVLPALFPEDPELNYSALEGVHKGDEASAAFADLADHNAEEIAVIRENLLKYCGLDTLAMVKILGKLRQCCE